MIQISNEVQGEAFESVPCRQKEGMMVERPWSIIRLARSRIQVRWVSVSLSASRGTNRELSSAVTEQAIRYKESLRIDGDSTSFYHLLFSVPINNAICFPFYKRIVNWNGKSNRVKARAGPFRALSAAPPAHADHSWGWQKSLHTPSNPSTSLFEIISQYTLDKINTYGTSHCFCCFPFITEWKILDRTFHWQVVVDQQILGVQPFLSPASHFVRSWIFH